HRRRHRRPADQTRHVSDARQPAGVLDLGRSLGADRRGERLALARARHPGGRSVELRARRRWRGHVRDAGLARGDGTVHGARPRGAGPTRGHRCATSLGRGPSRADPLPHARAGGAGRPWARARSGSGAQNAPAPGPSMSAERGFRLHFGVVTAVLLAATLAVGVLVSLGSAILVLAGGMLLLVIALLWNSVQSLTGESPLSFEEALSLGAPSAEEEQKRAVLRALKDLDYERSVGKLSEEDYAALSGRYRAEAKRLLKLIEEQRGPEHERIERLVRE